MRGAPATVWRRCCAARQPRCLGKRLTDASNAISVLHRIRWAAEDLTRYTAAPQLVRATGPSRSTPSNALCAPSQSPDPTIVGSPVRQNAREQGYECLHLDVVGTSGFLA
jgi:hypothetical protein